MQPFKDGDKVLVFIDGPGEIETAYRASDNMLVGEGGWVVGTPEGLKDWITDPERAAVIDRAMAVIGESKGLHWLGLPVAALGGQTPESLLDTPEGRERVLAILSQMEQGVW